MEGQILLLNHFQARNEFRTATCKLVLEGLPHLLFLQFF